MRAPISVCMIVKNEEKQLENCLKSFRDHVEELVIVDTGSTDSTPEIAKKYADIFEVYTECNNPETGMIQNFSQARQRSFDLATKNWILWVDGDDEIVGADKLHNVVMNMEAQRNGRPCYVTLPYEYAHDSKGNVIVRQYRERLVSPPSEFNWVNPVHEVINIKNPKTLPSLSEEVVFIHRRGDKQIEPNRNLRILKKLYEEQGDADARQLYYLGLEYGNVNDHENMIKMLNRYLELSGWDDEKYMACLRLGIHYLAIGQYEKAAEISLKATTCKEDWGEAYFNLAKSFYFLAQNGKDPQRNWQRCVHFARHGLSFPPTKTLLFVNPLEREYEIHKFLNVALNSIGDVPGALESARTGLERMPGDAALACNKMLYEKHLARIAINQELGKMIAIDAINQKSYDAIMSVLDGVAGPLPGNEKAIDVSFMVWNTVTNLQKQGNRVLNCFPKDGGLVIEPYAKNDDPKLDVIFFVGDGLEEWTPETVKKTGIGGSELMELQLAEKLAGLGHRVRLYNSCGVQEGIYNGVEYHQTSKFKNLKCDVLVVSRYASMLDDVHNITAQIKIIHVHDMVIVNAKHNYLLKAHRILALTNWHKQNLINEHGLHSDQITVTRNGIDLNRFDKKIKRNRFKVINSSSPDRSWPVLLECWPKIKEQVPEATLELFYGFDNWKKLAPFRTGEAETIKRLEDQIASLKDQGVIYRGRTPQAQLADEFLSAGVLAFPTWFQETSCITGMEAQAAGLRIVSSNLAALKETVGSRGVLIDGEWTSEPYKTQFVKSVVEALRKENDEDRLVLQQYARENFGLDSLAKEWEELFYKLLVEVQSNPIIPYKSVYSRQS